MNYKLTIGWLYPDLMNTYGDRGNIICLKKRSEWHEIECVIKSLDVGFEYKELKKCDFIFMGGAQDKQQKIVSEDFDREKKETLKEIIENEKPGLYICGAYQFLGKYYKDSDGKIIDCLKILDFHTENPGLSKERLIGNIVIDLSKDIKNTFPINNYPNTMVGFENHGGRTYLGKSLKSFGQVLVGFGNNGEDKTEGILYKNSIGTYLHGPILPKNPHFADFLIKISLKQKYKENINLKPLDDVLEYKAHQAIAQRLNL